MIKFKQRVHEEVCHEAEYKGAVIVIDVGVVFEEHFTVHLIFGAFKIELGCFESLAEAKKYIKNGMNQIDNIIHYLTKINQEAVDFKLEPDEDE